MKFEVKCDFVFLQNVSFVVISLFCTWDSDILWSVMAVCFLCVSKGEGSVPANCCPLL